MKWILSFVAIASLAGCGPRDRQNSALCGLTFMAGANRVLDQMAQGYAFIPAPPQALLEGIIPTRVVGYAVNRSVPVVEGEKVHLQYEGEGLPQTPGFGVALIDDSTEVFRGVLIFETEPNAAFPEIGSVTDATHTVPLFAVRIHWTSVNDDSCALFPPMDTSSTSE